MAAIYEPIVNGAIDNLIETIQGISIAGGYNFDIKADSVTEKLQEVLLVPETELPFVLLQMSDGTRKWVEKPDGIRDDIVIDLVARLVEPDPLMRRTQGLRFASDLERALYVDPSRGGVMFDTTLDPPRLMYGITDDPNIILQHRITMPVYRTYGAP
jgi:hypothetical protein